MNILVTGGSGFIGSHVAERLTKEGHEVTILDLMAVPPCLKNQKLHYFPLDVLSPDSEKLFANALFDVVIHLAFKRVSIHRTDDFHQTLLENCKGLMNILNCSKIHKVKRFIIVSSYEVYGDQKGPINENIPMKPVNQVGFFWQIVESICQAYKSDDFYINILRTGTIYGPRHPIDYKNENEIITAIENIIFPGQKLVMPECCNLHDYIYILDVVDAIYKVIEGFPDSTLNISSGQMRSSYEIFKIVKEIHANYLNSKEVGQNRESQYFCSENIHKYEIEQATIDQNIFGYTSCDPTKNLSHADFDCSRAYIELEWSPKYSLEAGIFKTYIWERENLKFASEPTIDESTEKVRMWPHRLRHHLNIGPEFDTIFIFIITSIINWLMLKRLAINYDFMILYVTLINLFYGLKQGGMAIILAIFARLIFMIFGSNTSNYELLTNVNQIMYFTIYIILGFSTGYMVDIMNYKLTNYMREIEDTKAELNVMQELYDQSVEVNHSLQSRIELNNESLGKVLYMVNQFISTPYDEVYDVIANFVSEIIKAQSVQLYRLSQQGKWLRLISSVGEPRFGHSIQINEYPFLKLLIDGQEIYFNHDLLPNVPIICAPIVIVNHTIAALFIDQVDFNHLDQYFIDIVKILSQLIATCISRMMEYEKDVAILKYYPQTMIMRPEWFEHLLKMLHQSDNKLHQHYVIFKVLEKHEISDYRKIYSQISNLIRDTDTVGVLNTGHLGLLINHFEGGDVQSIADRLSKIGYTLELLEGGDTIS